MESENQISPQFPGDQREICAFVLRPTGSGFPAGVRSVLKRLNHVFFSAAFSGCSGLWDGFYDNKSRRNSVVKGLNWTLNLISVHTGVLLAVQPASEANLQFDTQLDVSSMKLFSPRTRPFSLLPVE